MRQDASRGALTYRLLLALTLLSMTAVLLTSCGPKPQAVSPQHPARPGGATIALNGAGATFPYPLYAKWIDAYKTIKSNVSINYQSIGSGGGIKELQAGTVDFGASDVPLNNDETRRMPAPVIHLPMTAGAVALAYNLPGVAKGLKLTPDVVTGMFMGDITKWNDVKITALNPGVKLPNIAVAIIHRSDGSGTTYLFTSYLAAVSKAWADKVGAGKSVNWPAGIGGKGNEGVAGVLKQSPGSLGYVELAYADQNKLAYAALQNSAGQFVLPSIDSVKAAATSVSAHIQKDVRTPLINTPGKAAYPISGFTYILIYQTQKDAQKGAALLDFLTWATRDGQQYAAPLGYAQLPDAVITANEAALKTVTIAGQAAPRTTP